MEPNTSMTRNRIWASAGIIGFLALDLLSKTWAEHFFRNRGPLRVIGSYFIMTFSENHGGFLSLGASISGLVWNLIFIVVPILVIAAIIFYLFFKPASAISRWSYVLIISGGLGNVIDRVIREGYVRDFLNFGVGTFRTGILNIADIYVTIGVILLFFGQRDSERALNSKEGAKGETELP